MALFYSLSYLMLLRHLSLLTTITFLKFSTYLASDFTFSWVIFTSQSSLSYPLPLFTSQILVLPKELIFCHSFYNLHSPWKIYFASRPWQHQHTDSSQILPPTPTFLEWHLYNLYLSNKYFFKMPCISTVLDAFINIDLFNSPNITNNIPTLWGGCYYLYLNDEETKAQRG